MMRAIALTAAIAVTLGACAGRAPQPVAVVQVQDRYMDCEAIIAEVEGNNRRISELAQEQGLKTTQNVVAGVAGFVVPVLWLGMDWQGTAGTEIAALQARQQYLTRLAEERCAKPAAAPPAAKRPVARGK